MSTTLTIRIDKQDKEQAEKILKKLGLTLSAAINIFIKAIIRNNGIPFALTNDAFDYPSITKMVKKKNDFLDQNWTSYIKNFK